MLSYVAFTSYIEKHCVIIFILKSFYIEVTHSALRHHLNVMEEYIKGRVKTPNLIKILLDLEAKTSRNKLIFYTLAVVALARGINFTVNKSHCVLNYASCSYVKVA